MQFWGVEVKSGETLNCDPGPDKYLHLSQAVLGEIQNAKGNARVHVYAHAGGREFLIGTLTYGKCDQISLDIVFREEFKLSHSCKMGSVFFCGYTAVIHGDDGSSEEEGTSGESSDSESENDKQAQTLMHTAKEKGKAGAKLARREVAISGAKPAKPEAGTAGKANRKLEAEALKPVGGKSTEEDEAESEDEDEDEDEDEEMGDSSDEEDESDESEDESEEDKSLKVPKAEPAAKKRPLPDLTIETSAEKKTKMAASSGVQKAGTDGGKKGEPKMLGGTPHLGVKQQNPSSEVQTLKAKGTSGAKETAKPGAKPASEKKAGEHVCVTCSRNFATEAALNQHNNAKHK